MDFNYDTEEYPTHIIIPEDYWVMTTTADVDDEG